VIDPRCGTINFELFMMDFELMSALRARLFKMKHERSEHHKSKLIFRHER